jgi:hypothetical protein
MPCNQRRIQRGVAPRLGKAALIRILEKVDPLDPVAVGLDDPDRFTTQWRAFGNGAHVSVFFRDFFRCC